VKPIFHFIMRQLSLGKSLAHRHDLDPRVFLVLSLCGLAIHALYYLPSLKGQAVNLAFLVTLRFLGLVGPLYILFKGKRIAATLNTSLVLSWTASTAWHVCYFVYL
jgi:hypothetical protein